MENPLLENGLESSNNDDALGQRTVNIFSLGVKITLIISLIFNVAMVYIGIWGMHKCTIETIPFFLIATGGIGFFSKSSTLAQPPITHYMVDIWWKYIRKAETALYFIEIVLLLFGSFWVFKEFKPHFIPSADPSILYCDKTVYYFAFYYLVAIYFVFGIVIIWYYLVLCCIYAMLLLEHRNT